MLALVSEFNCFLRSRCSMEMWCPDDIGRDSWDWVGRLLGREHASTPQSGVEAPRLLKRSLTRLYYCRCCCCCCCFGKVSTKTECVRPQTHHNDAQVTETYLHELITCVMSSYPRLKADSRRQSAATVELQSCMHCPLPGASRCTTTGMPKPTKNCTRTCGISAVCCTVCTVDESLLHNRNVQHAEDERKLRHLQLGHWTAGTCR